MATSKIGVAATNIASLVLPGKFEPYKDNWENYREQLFFALDAAGPVDDVQKRALFLSQCGKEAYALVVSLLAPRKPSEVPFEEVIDVVNKFFVPKPHPILEVNKFYQRKQKENESMTSFVAALHDISSRCKFHDIARRMIEQITLGVRDNSLRKEILKMKLADISYETVVQRVLNYEAIQTGLMSSVSLSDTDGAPTPMSVDAINSKSQCGHCAKRHGESKCRFINATCYKCHKKGHTRAACKTKVADKVQSCEDEKGSSDCEDSFGVRVHGVSGSESAAAAAEPLMVEVTVNGVLLRMEVDSGSARTILPHSLYVQHRQAFPGPLLPFEKKLVTWTNSELKVKGCELVDVQYGERKAKLPMVISCGSGPPLLGRAWFEALGIAIQGVHTVDLQDTFFEDKFPQLFNDDIDKYSGPLIHIDCRAGVQPVFLPARPIPFSLREKVNVQLKKMIDNNILTPVKHSQWATPLRIVPKPDGSLRLCGDYRTTVNAGCLADNYPLPTSNEAFFNLSGGKYFSKIDLKQAYNQLKVDEETAELLTLNTPLGLMRMNRLAYGVNAAPAIFQRLMISLLAGIEGVACLLDDIAVCGYTLEEHNNRVEKVLKRLDNIGLTLNKTKCVFTANKVTFLGFEIDGEGVHPSKEKVEEIAKKPPPRNKTTLKAFLGLYNFYERFLKDKATTLEPLHRLLKDDAEWKWGKEQQLAFEKAKKMLTSDLTLTHYSLDKELHMICDASDYGVGAVLVHKMEDGMERPVIMGSRTLKEHERRYAQIDKEALAIMFGLIKFRQYLLGRRFVIFTDHKPLLGIFGRNKPIPELVSARMMRWAMTMNTYNYDLQYRPGKDMGDADSLSRWPTPSEIQTGEDVMLIEQMHGGNINSKMIAKETDKDGTLKKVKFYLLNGWPDKIENLELLPYHRRREFLSLNKECIMWSNRVVIPTKLQKQVLNLLHEGHSGIVQTKMMARGYLWFPTLDKDIDDLISNCNLCQMGRNNPPITEHTWQAAIRPWSRVHVDFMGPFLGKTFLVLVDSYSKWPIVEIVPTMSSKSVIEILRRAFADNGVPDIIVSDNGLAFTSSEFKEFVLRNSIKHLTGAPYHPATNGQAERTIQTIKAKLKKQSPNMPWAERVAKMLFQMRTAPSTVTGKTPAELLNGRKLRTSITQIHPDADNSTEVEEEERNEDNHAQSKQKKIFNEGDYVLMRLYNTDKKWQRGRIICRREPSVYEVESDSGGRHRRHVDQLLRTRPPQTQTSTENENASQHSSNEDELDVVIPPPEEWNEIIGC